MKPSPWVAVEHMRPDIIALNDLDHLPANRQLALFSLLERFRGVARIILVTANDPSKLAPPLRGPGRVDDIITVPGLSLAEIERVIGVADVRFVGWPIKYVQDWSERKRVLGVDEYETVAARLAALRGAAKSTAPHPFGNGFHLDYPEGPELSD